MEFENKNEINNALEKFTRNLTLNAKDGKTDPIIGREDEIDRVIQILSRKTKNNPVLIGEPGVGKTAVVEGLAQRIIKNDVPSQLKNKTILELDMGSLMAGASYMGEFEKRLKSIINEINKKNGEIILFIDELHLIVGAGRTQGSLDVSNLLKPALARGELKTIGATTLNEYREYIEKDAALERRFQKVLVNEPTINETISILRGLKERFETYHKVRIHDNAIVAAVKLSSKYITDRFLPDKAIDLIDEASAVVKTESSTVPKELDQLNRKIIQIEIEVHALENESDTNSQKRLKEIKEELNFLKKQQKEISDELQKEKTKLNTINNLKKEIEKLKFDLTTYENEGEYQKASEIKYSLLPNSEKKLKDELKSIDNYLIKEEVNEDIIAKIISKSTGIPIANLLKNEKEKILGLEKWLNDKVIGQKKAIHEISNSILRNRSGISNSEKPIGSFLFLGSTGVGKTEIARSLAEFLFNSSKKMIRLDMSEYMEKHSISKLIGSPPGYIGYNEGGKLTESVRRNPYSIVLFDEIEKAHPDVNNLLLQILDDGRLTDSSGRTVDFKNTIIIMTSNIGSEYMLDSNSENSKENHKLINKKLKEHFRPEFLNRLDNIIFFNPLSHENIMKIIDINLEALTNRLYKDKNFLIKFSDNAKSKIFKEGYIREFGARPIKRYIEKNIETLLAINIIKSNIVENKKYIIDVDENDNFILDDVQINN